MHPGRILSQALALLAANQHQHEALDNLDTLSVAFDEPPSYTDGVCDNKLVAQLPFCNGSLSIDERVDDLVARIPLEETFGLLVNNASAAESVQLPPYGWWSEGLHGVALSPAVRFEAPTLVATSFPQVISLAASFNRTLFYKVGEVISTEARAFYNAKHAGLTFWTPNINIYRDPRWGRGQETPGEDPLLSGEYAVAFVRGLQGEAPEDRHHKNASSEFKSGSSSSVSNSSKFLKVSASCKHFSSYSQEVPRHRNDAIVTKRDQLDTYFPAFEDCVKRGHVSSLMCSYNAVNGIPACADKALMTDLVRKQWGFDGYIVSDCGAVADVIYNHHYTQSPEQTCATTINAGMDINCGDFLSTHAKKAVESGLLRKPMIHKALKNLFRVQMRLGMFEQGRQPFANLTHTVIDTPAHRELALEAARQAVVLLKNENATLPLSASAFAGSEKEPLALIGPHFNASEVLLGNYQGIPSHIVTPIEGIAKYAEHVTYALGCKVSGEKVPDFDEAEQVAAEAARVVLFVGLDQTQEREEIDRSHLKLPGFQNELIELVLKKAKKPIVIVVISGGGVDLKKFAKHPKVGAILFAGYLGQAGGQAIADVLFGAYNPSGKLTQTFYTNEFANQVSIYDMNMRPTPDTGNPGRTYRFLSNFDMIVYSVGDGLSYTEFKIDWQNSEPKSFLDAGMIKQALANRDDASKPDPTYLLNITVTNVGKVDGEYVLTVFTFPHGSGTEGKPICYLCAFGRTPLLKPQEKSHFQFEIPIKTFALANAKGEWEVVEGAWHFQLSSRSENGAGHGKTETSRHELHIGSFKDSVSTAALADDSELLGEPLKEMHMHAVESVLEMQRD